MLNTSKTFAIFQWTCFKVILACVLLFTIRSSSFGQSGVYYTHDKPRSTLAVLTSNAMRIARVKNMVGKDFERERHKKAQMPKQFNKIFGVEKYKVGGEDIWTISPLISKENKTVVYLHGGAYVYGMHTLYWSMIKKLILETNATVIIPDYPLVPENNASDVYTFLQEFYSWLESKEDVSNISFLGDSAGGGLVLGFTQQLRNEGKTLPGQLILLSPWLDINLDNPAIDPIEEKDPELSREALIKIGKAYAGHWDTNDFRLSPIVGDFHDLPPMSIFSSTHDILFADAEVLRKKYESLDIPLNYYVYPKLFHDWLVVSSLKESKNTFYQLNELLNNLN